MMKKQAAAKRSGKTLAWFLNEQLEKNSMDSIMNDQQQQENRERETSSPFAVDANRKSSIDSLASSVNSANNNKDELVGGAKKRGKKAGRQRVKKVSVNFTIAGSENKESAGKAASAAPEDKPATVAVAPIPTSLPTASMLVNKERKEDYWYYDPLSDGFYYENNGSRGWKKRNPKVHGPPPSVPKKLPEIEKMDTQKFQKAIVANQKLLNTIGAAPSVKYYDPASDGYFFEMASVDGWRRRQPPVSSASASSVVANHKPMNVPTSAQSSVRNTANPYYPVGSFSSTTATPTPSPAGSFMPQTAAMTNAQLEELIVRHPSIVASMSRNRLGGAFDEPCVPSNSSTTSSEELTSSPPPLISSQPEHSLLMQHFRRGQHLQQSNSASMLINSGGNTSCPSNTTFSVGSSDEPYEFYWSDNEKASSISSYDDGGDNMKEQSVPREILSGVQRRPTTLSVGPEKPKQWWDVNASEQQQRFDVDRFIADLPSFDDDKILRNLTALPTPHYDRHSSQHSNLVTPSKQAAWWTPYGSDANGKNEATPIKNLEKDLEKIWQAPCV